MGHLENVGIPGDSGETCYPEKTGRMTSSGNRGLAEIHKNQENMTCGKFQGYREIREKTCDPTNKKRRDIQKVGHTFGVSAPHS